MTASTLAVWNPAAIFIVTSALRKCGVINEEETPTAAMLTDAMFALNGLTKELQATGLHVWAEEEGILFLQQGQVRYLLGGATTDHACDAYSYVSPTLAVSAALGASTITLSSASGIADDYGIGVVLDDGSTQWTTVNGAPAGAVVTLTDALTGAASSGNYVFAYAVSAALGRPLKVPKGRLLYFSGSREVPMTTLSRQEYMDFPLKTSPGAPTQFFYSPKLVSGQLFVYLDPQSASQTGAVAMRFTWYRQIFDWTDTTTTADFPQEWLNMLVWNLAKEMAPDFDVPERRYLYIKTEADSKRELVENYDREPEDIQFGFECFPN